jgi:mRNA-degrading endonuclease toxin of MazEF toxin-antitoxin module
LLKNLVLIRGKVVWINFGFNVGCEFGGRHPGVILKNIGECLIVAPITSGEKDIEDKRQIDLTKMYDFKARTRYTDISRIIPVSIYRVDLNDNIGRIPKESLDEIKTAIANYW